MQNRNFDLLKHPQTGKEIRVKRGFSWTVALFGPIALAIRDQ